MPIKDRWLRLSVQYQAIVMTSLVLLAIGIPAATLLIRTQQQATETSFKQSALAIAEVFRHNLEQDMKSNNRQHIEATLAKVGESGYITRALVISNTGLVSASSQPSDIGKTHSDPELASAIASGETLIRANKNKEHGEGLEIILPVINQPDCYPCHDAQTPILGAIEVALDTQPLTRQNQQYISLMILIAAVTLLLVGLTLAYGLRQAVLKPLTNDITRLVDKHEREERLYLTGRLSTIGELASGIAHELNNPLTSVIGFSELLLEKDVPDDVKEDLRIINREAQRTSRIVRNLLTFARKHPEVKRPVNINEVISGVLELRTYEQKLNNIEVNTHFAADLPEVIADGFQLQQVFLNIIINAEYFMTEAHQRGTLTITTEPVGDIIRVSLADDGPGIAQENLGHVFDPFFTTKEVGKGTGLGLSICHGIVTEHGGRIYAESELGKGATFIVELPINNSNREAP